MRKALGAATLLRCSCRRPAEEQVLKALRGRVRVGGQVELAGRCQVLGRPPPGLGRRLEGHDAHHRRPQRHKERHTTQSSRPGGRHTWLPARCGLGSPGAAWLWLLGPPVSLLRSHPCCPCCTCHCQEARRAVPPGRPHKQPDTRMSLVRGSTPLSGQAQVSTGANRTPLPRP